MPVPFFDLSRQAASLNPSLLAATENVMGSQQFIMGEEVRLFEEELGRYLGVEYSIACASGTDALLLPLKALDPGPGDEVIVPAFTFFATAGAAWNAGFRPVFCDVEPDTFNMSAATIAPHVGPKTRAIVVVHLFGQMAPMDGIMDLAEAHDLVVIEDVAQSIGARQRVRGREAMAGAVGHVGAHSFFPTKNLGAAGDAGLVSARDEELARRIGLLRTHGGRKMYHHELVGTNSRLDTLQAAILRVKLPLLEGFLEGRRSNAAAYAERLGGMADLHLPTVERDSVHTYNQFTLRTERRDELSEHLSAKGIGNKVYYPRALHLQECFAELGVGEGSLPVAEHLCSTVLSLPIFPEMSAAEIDEVSTAIREFFGA